MHDLSIFETAHWRVSHRRDARYPGYLIVSSRLDQPDLHDLPADALAELGLVLKRTGALLTRRFAPCKVIYYKLGFSAGFSCHFHVAPVTADLLDAIIAHPDFADQPDGNDAILFLSRIYCERALSEEEQQTLYQTASVLRQTAAG